MNKPKYCVGQIVFTDDGNLFRIRDIVENLDGFYYKGDFYEHDVCSFHEEDLRPDFIKYKES